MKYRLLRGDVAGGFLLFKTKETFCLSDSAKLRRGICKFFSRGANVRPYEGGKGKQTLFADLWMSSVLDCTSTAISFMREVHRRLHIEYGFIDSLYLGYARLDFPTQSSRQKRLRRSRESILPNH